MDKKEQYFAYYNGILYRLNCKTSKPIKPGVVVCAIGIKLWDSAKKAILLEKSECGVKCYNQPPVDTFSCVDEVSYKLSELERDRVIQVVTEIGMEQIQQLPVIWVIELYDGGCMVMPEAKTQRFLL